MTRALITGGAGFLGLHLARRLLEGDVTRLHLADDFSRGRDDRDLCEVARDPRVDVVRVDLTREDQLGRLPREVDEVYHLAAVNGTRHFYEAPDRVVRVNVLSTMNLLGWIVDARGAGGAAPRLLVASSSEVYAGGVGLLGVGDLPVPTPEGVALVVPDPHEPRWSYAASKLIGEVAAASCARCRGLPTVVVRPHNFYGPRAGDDHVVPETIVRVLDCVDPFPVYGADQTRAFCYVSDGVDAMARLIRVADPSCPIVHVGSHLETRVADILPLVCRLAGWHPAIVCELPARSGSVARRVPDVRRVFDLVGWRASTDLEEGLRRTFDWHVADRSVVA